MNKYEIWCEGYAATGEHAPANLYGIAEGDTFREAAISLLGDKLDKNDDGTYRLSIWACKLYDNEIDARKNFG